MTDDFSAPDILEALRAAPERSDATERAGLQAFLAQARVWRGGVSARPAPRLTGWKFNFFKKEISPMTTLATIILVMALAVGGTGCAVYAAQDSLPTEPLYAVKLAAEQTRLAWATDPADQIDLLLGFTQTRLREMTRLVEQNQAVPDAVTARLQTQLQLALQTAAQLRDAELTAVLAHIRQTTETQLQALAQLRLSASDNPNWDVAEQAMTQTRALAELGEQDPAQFRHQLQSGAPEDKPGGNGYGPGPQATPVYSATQSNGGNGYGPGPSTPCGACTPEQDGNSYGPGPGNPSVTPSGDNNNYGEPQPTGTPQPGGSDGNGAGPGPQPSSTCTPLQDGSGGPSLTPPADGNGNGPQPTGTPGQHGKP